MRRCERVDAARRLCGAEKSHGNANSPPRLVSSRLVSFLPWRAYQTDPAVALQRQDHLQPRSITVPSLSFATGPGAFQRQRAAERDLDDRSLWRARHEWRAGWCQQCVQWLTDLLARVACLLTYGALVTIHPQTSPPMPNIRKIVHRARVSTVLAVPTLPQRATT